MYSVVRFAMIVATAACLSPQFAAASTYGPVTWDAITKEPAPSPTGVTPSLASPSAPSATIWGPTTWNATFDDKPTGGNGREGSTTVSVTADEDSAAWTVSVAASLASLVLAALWLR